MTDIIDTLAAISPAHANATTQTSSASLSGMDALQAIHDAYTTAQEHVSMPVEAYAPVMGYPASIMNTLYVQGWKGT